MSRSFNLSVRPFRARPTDRPTCRQHGPTMAAGSWQSVRMGRTKKLRSHIASNQLWAEAGWLQTAGRRSWSARDTTLTRCLRNIIDRIRLTGDHSERGKIDLMDTATCITSKVILFGTYSSHQFLLPSVNGIEDGGEAS